MRYPLTIASVAALAALLPSLPALAVLPTDPAYVLTNPALPDPANPGQYLSYEWALNDLNLPEAWKYTQGSTNVKIGVVDTGIVTATPDLQGQFLPPQNSLGITSYEGTASVNHGTWVASVINMKWNNGIGGAGVGNFTLQPIRATDPNGNTTDAYIISAIQMAASEGCRVITISLSASNYNTINAAVTAQLAANKAAGLPDFLVFMAAGNDNSFKSLGDNTQQNDPLDFASSRLPTDNIVFVGGTNESDTRWATSTFVGSDVGNYIDLAAPAQDIFVADGTNGYATASGTSFASPFAASAAAMVWSVNPTLTANQVQNILFDTANNPDRTSSTPAGPFWDQNYGWGRVDIGAAVDAAILLPGAIIPEPASLLLLAAGSAGLLMRRKRNAH